MTTFSNKILTSLWHDTDTILTGFWQKASAVYFKWSTLANIQRIQQLPKIAASRNVRNFFVFCFFFCCWDIPKSDGFAGRIRKKRLSGFNWAECFSSEFCQLSGANEATKAPPNGHSNVADIVETNSAERLEIISLFGRCNFKRRCRRRTISSTRLQTDSFMTSLWHHYDILVTRS